MTGMGSAAVVIGDGVVTLRRKGRAPVVARILADTVDDCGSRRLVLDRLIHERSEETLDGWLTSGPVVTILHAPAA